MSRLTDSEWQVLQVLWDTGGAALAGERWPRPCGPRPAGAGILC